VGKDFDSSFIAPSFRGALSMRLVVEGAIIIIVPLIVSFLFGMVSFLASAFDLVMGISVADDVVQVMVIPVSPLVAFLRWSQTTGRVPSQILSVVRILTPHITATLGNRVHYGCCVQHCLEALNMHVDFFIVFRQVGCELIDEHP
jgi:hypothetical protein